VTDSRRVLVLGAPVGGCERVATAIAEAFSVAAGSAAVVETPDLFKRFTPRLAQLVAMAHRTDASFMPDGNASIAELARGYADDPLARELSSGAIASLEAMLETLRPAAVVATHAVVAAASAELRARHDFVAASVACDLMPRRLWTHPRTDLLCVAGEDVRERAVLQGVPWDRVAVTGVPAREAFLAGPAPARRARARAVLVAPGERPAARVQLVRDLEAAGMEAADASEGDPAALVRAADLVVCAGGGELLWSAPAAGIPLLLLGEPPAAEQASADLLAAAGAALLVRDAEHLASVVAYLVRRPERLATLRDAAARLGRPAAARAVVERVLSLMG
jgi:UDP-N-acetylglucosamine:LPS N-acetylglucosamine transferase